MAKKLPGTEINPLFLGALRHYEERETLSELDLKKAHSKTKAAKFRARGTVESEKN
jgi:hypothetical protein